MGEDMKRIFILFGIFICVTAFAQTININWIVDGQQYGTPTTCEYSGDVILPTPPTKYGYTFAGWEPSEYIFLEYIESTGTQWIDTGVVFSSSYNRLDYEFRASVYSITSNENDIISNEDSNQTGFNIGIFANNQIVFYSGKYISGQSVNACKTPINPNDIFVDINGYFSTNGFKSNLMSQEYAYITYTPQNSSTIKIFKNAWVGNRFYKGKIYFLKIKLDNILVRDFVPAKRISDNAVGMYDTVTGTFFGNAGTGTFIAGPVAN